MNTQEFIKKMSDDEALAKKLSECMSPEEAFETAKEAGLTDDIDSFTAIMTEVNKQVNGELSDKELESVAGGTDSAGVEMIIAMGSFAVGTAAFAATIAAA